jgi:hypothetical protein
MLTTWMPKLRKEMPSGTRGGRNAGSKPLGPRLRSSAGRKVEVRTGGRAGEADGEYECCRACNASCSGSGGSGALSAHGESADEGAEVNEVESVPRLRASKSEDATDEAPVETNEACDAVESRRSCVCEEGGGGGGSDVDPYGKV